MQSREWTRRFIERRVELGLTQSELARAAGVTQQAVSYIERGVGVPRVTTMLALSRVLGTTIEQLFAADARERHRPLRHR